MAIEEPTFTIIRFKQRAVALALIGYPLLAGIAFAVHPNLASLSVRHEPAQRIVELHGNSLMHFGHFLMVLGVPMLIVIALHLMKILERTMPVRALAGASLAITGAIVLAMDKAALCLVPSAFDTLTEAEFSGLIPGLTAMFQYRGYMWVLKLLPLLSLGFIILGYGLVRSQAMKRQQAIPILLGSILTANPDIDLIGLIATGFLAIGFIPYAIQLWRSDPCKKTPAGQ